MIQVEGLTKRFGDFTALDSVSFQVGEGEIFGLLGPNGAGKTTTVRILASLLRPSGGRATVAGFDVVANATRVRENVGILTEVPGLYERLTASEYLDFFGQMYGVPQRLRRDRIEKLLSMLGIWDRRNQRLDRFSKGMKQKIAIARTLMHQPKVLFFDEPTAALDPESARTVRDYLLELIRQEGRTILLCTHNLHEAERLCDRVGLISRGRLLAHGKPRQLLGADQHHTTLRLRALSPDLVAAVEKIDGVGPVTPADSSIVFDTTDPEQVNPRVVRRVVEMGGEVVSLSVEAMPLEEAYLELMKRAQA